MRESDAYLPGFTAEKSVDISNQNYYQTVYDLQIVNIIPMFARIECDSQCLTKCQEMCRKLNDDHIQCTIECAYVCCPEMGPYI